MSKKLTVKLLFLLLKKNIILFFVKISQSLGLLSIVLKKISKITLSIT